MPTSPIAPSVLVLDDGELANVAQLLERLGADHVRLVGDRDISGKIQQPRDLLITSGKRTLDMPQLEALPDDTPPPTWISVHSQDFLPLRERMRGLGVNFLVHSSLDTESLRLFLLQLLYRGSERRSSRRLPMGREVTLVAAGLEKVGRLIEVSPESCRVLCAEPAEFDAAITIVLPTAISNGVHCELDGTAQRSSICQTRNGETAYSIVVRYGELEAPVRAALTKMARGEQIGTPVSPLAGAEPNPIEDLEVESNQTEARSEPETRERRRAPRNVYERQVLVLEETGSDDTRLGCDLSLTGVRVRGYSELGVGAEVTLALYGSRREEPIVVRASLVRKIGEDEVAFQFGGLDDAQCRGLEKLSVGLGRLDSLESDGPVVVTKILAR